MTHVNDMGLSLFELNTAIKSEIKASFDRPFWVKAEIAQLKENYSGHCYLELAEKDATNDKIIAQAKATIWANTYRMLKPYFETTTGRSLTEGLKILVCVKVDFHEVYGLSLNITDIDPSFTVGDLALKKAETIKKLKEEGVYDMNRELEFPLVPQRIAVISSSTAAGYEDFIKHLESNAYEYKFEIQLFPATMQGEKAEESIIVALEHINRFDNNFDVVAIIRGGGSQTDLSCFDSYWLALHVAQFPLPVLTGIGHEQDESVTDMVANTRLKTPTAVAAFLIECINEFESTLDELKEQTFTLVEEIISDHNQTLSQIISGFPKLIEAYIHNEKLLLERKLFLSSSLADKKIKEAYHLQTLIVHQLSASLKQRYFGEKLKIGQQIQSVKNAIILPIENAKSVLALAENTSKHVNPEQILKKGYSITLFNQKPVTNVSELNELDMIETRLFRGRIISQVKGLKQ